MGKNTMYKKMATNTTTSFLIIALLCLMSSATRFVMDSYLPSLPAMSKALGVSGNDIQLTLTLYILGFGLSQLIYGPLSDRFGRKPVLIAGLMLFLSANTLCALTSSPTWLLTARLISGIGIGSCGVLTRAIASDCFSGAAFSKAWTYTTTTLVFVLIFAPLIGMAVQTWLNWRANFMVATLYVCVVLALVRWKLPETNHFHRLATVNISSVLSNYRFILRSPLFLTSTLCYTLSFAGLITYFQVSPLLLIQVFHLSPIEYGASTLLIAICYLIGGQVVSRLVHRVGTQVLLFMGILLLISGGLAMLLWNACFTPSVYAMLLPMILYVIGARIVIPNALSGAFNGLKQLGGSASGMIGGIQMLGSAMVSFIVTWCNYQTPLPLALILTLLGVATLSILAMQMMEKAANEHSMRILLEDAK